MKHQTKPIFPVFALKVMHRVIRFCKLLTTVAMLSARRPIMMLKLYIVVVRCVSLYCMFTMMNDREVAL